MSDNSKGLRVPAAAVVVGVQGTARGADDKDVGQVAEVGLLRRTKWVLGTVEVAEEEAAAAVAAEPRNDGGGGCFFFCCSMKFPLFFHEIEKKKKKKKED